MSFVDKIFKDNDGKTVLSQTPNLPLITFGISLLLSKVTGGTAQQLFDVLAFGSLFVFAWLELFNGVNYFRRALGLTVILILIANKIGQ